MPTDAFAATVEGKYSSKKHIEKKKPERTLTALRSAPNDDVGVCLIAPTPTSLAEQLSAVVRHRLPRYRMDWW